MKVVTPYFLTHLHCLISAFLALIPVLVVRPPLFVHPAWHHSILLLLPQDNATSATPPTASAALKPTFAKRADPATSYHRDHVLRAVQKDAVLVS